jgi:hypothetical protein
MLPRTKKQKGKQLEKYVANELKKIFKYVYSRADSGSGKLHKEDITILDDIPLFIECKNQAEPKINEWFKDILNKCPDDKYPVLIYKKNYQKPKVVMYFHNLIDFISKTGKIECDGVLKFLVEFDFEKFINLLKTTYEPNTKNSL